MSSVHSSSGASGTLASVAMGSHRLLGRDGVVELTKVHGEDFADRRGLNSADHRRVRTYPRAIVVISGRAEGDLRLALPKRRGQAMSGWPYLGGAEQLR